MSDVLLFSFPFLFSRCLSFHLWLRRHPKLMTTVLRTTTTDFKSYTPYKAVLQFSTGGDPYPYTMPTVKSMARSDVDGTTIMVVFEDGIVVYKSTVCLMLE